MWPHSWQPTKLPCPWDSPGKNTGEGCHFLLQCRKVKSECEVAQSCPILSDPIDCSRKPPPSMGFSRQEYWSGVPLPSPWFCFLSISKLNIALNLYPCHPSSDYSPLLGCTSRTHLSGLPHLLLTRPLYSPLFCQWMIFTMLNLIMPLPTWDSLITISVLLWR